MALVFLFITTDDSLGAYSIVKKAKDRNTGEVVAIKIILKSQMSEDDETSLFVFLTLQSFSGLARGINHESIKESSQCHQVEGLLSRQ